MKRGVKGAMLVLSLMVAAMMVQPAAAGAWNKRPPKGGCTCSPCKCEVCRCVGCR